MSKRVGCLYRVSTLKQVEKDDIPMQRTSCREFIETHKDWKLEKEYLEKGISGYKLKEKDRDVLQDIRKDVTDQKIDILLVFMFDRIGRREDESPFVVEWLIKKGIEVWSVKEGQRKIENRTDKLLNYITYWQAGGESEKTSIRVKERQIQMAEEGILTYGGARSAPYGYDSIKSGTYTKKGVERYKLIINEEEAKVVKQIYKLVITKGYGMRRIAKELNDNNIKPKRGDIWNPSSIGTILRNPIYMGYPAYNKKSGLGGNQRRTEAFENWILPKKQIKELVIVTEKDWYKAKEIKESRGTIFKENTSNRPLQTKSKLLFIGIIKCGYCGRKLTSAGSQKKENGNYYEYKYYKCPEKDVSRSCNLVQKCYRRDYIENSILDVINDYLNDIENMDMSNRILKEKLSDQSKEKEELEKIEKQILNKEEELNILKKEVIKTLDGTSIYSTELLNELIVDKNKEIEDAVMKKSQLELLVVQKDLEEKDFENFKNLIPIWKNEFETTDIEIKKMLLTEIIKEIRLYNEKIEVDLRLKINYNNYKNITVINSSNINKNNKIIENTKVIRKDA